MLGNSHLLFSILSPGAGDAQEHTGEVVCFFAKQGINQGQ